MSTLDDLIYKQQNYFSVNMGSFLNNLQYQNNIIKSALKTDMDGLISYLDEYEVTISKLVSFCDTLISRLEDFKQMIDSTLEVFDLSPEYIKSMTKTASQIEGGLMASNTLFSNVEGLTFVIDLHTAKLLEVYNYYQWKNPSGEVGFIKMAMELKTRSKAISSLLAGVIDNYYKVAKPELQKVWVEGSKLPQTNPAAPDRVFKLIF